MEEKKNINLSAFNLAAYAPTTNVERESTAGGVVNWGQQNKYPLYLYDTINQCATLSAVLNKSVDFTIGNDIVNNSSIQGENSLGETIVDVISKLIMDRWYYGGFAFQVIYNGFGEVSEIAYLDFRKVRTDKNGEFIYVNEQWLGNNNKNNLKKYNSFNLNTGLEDKIQIYYYKGSKTRSVYPMPEYIAGLVSAETQIEIQKFHYASLVNNFVASAIIHWNQGNVEKEVQLQIENGLSSKFSGSENAAKFIMDWNETPETALTIDRISSDDFDKRYEALSESTSQNLFIALAASPQLFGLNYNSGFSEIEYTEAFKYYNRTAVLPKQKEIIRVFDRVLGNGSISFAPFSLEDTTTTNNQITEEQKIIDKTE